MKNIINSFALLSLLLGTLSVQASTWGTNTKTINGNPGWSLFDTTATDRMVIDSVGNVGIGTTSPSVLLEVAGDVRIGNSSITCAASNEGALRYNPTTKKMQLCASNNWNTLRSNAAPSANDLSISGNLENTQTLTGTYTYADDEEDPEATTTFQWQIADDQSGTNTQDISGATNATYTLTSNEVGKYVRFQVTPNASQGTLAGAPYSISTASVITADITPDAFSFTDQSDTAVNTLITSNSITITGINGASSVSVTGDGTPQVRINGGSWVTSGTINNNETLEVQLTSHTDYLTERTATVTVGGVSDIWNVTTASNAWTGTCGTDTVADADGNNYNTVEIGGHCWMATNLNVGTQLTSTDSSDNGIIEKYCYDEDSANCDAEGGLYFWDEAMGYTTTEGAQGICPDGWHIPTDNEFTILGEGQATAGCLSGTGWQCDPAGTALKSGGTSGFDALHPGVYAKTPGYTQRGTYGLFPTSTEYDSNTFWYHGVFPYYSTWLRDYSAGGKAQAFPIRCIQDTPTIVDARDSQVYRTITVGDQTWMAENLNIGTMLNNGSSSPTDNATIEKWCMNNIESNCDRYGGLYDWDEMMAYTTTQGAQGICMDGWHVPSSADWLELELYLDPTVATVDNADYRGTTIADDLLSGGIGFDLLVSGWRSPSSEPNSTGHERQWSSTESGTSAWERLIYDSNQGVRLRTLDKANGFSVRCIKDRYVTDARDGKQYKTVTIGGQTWMAENLNVGTRIDGTTDASHNATIEKYCYNDSESNCDTEGGLYSWDEMMAYSTTDGAQGICPDGWHIPTDAEWYTLENYVDSTINDPNATGSRGTDGGSKLRFGGITGFEALLAGYRVGGDGSFSNRGSWTFFWGGEKDSSNGWRREIGSNATIYREALPKTYGSSVRCIKNGKTVFVTDGTWTGNLGGHAGADAKCQAEADANGISGTFMAWVGKPSTRFSILSTTPYYRLDGTKIADSYTDLTSSSSLTNPISITPSGATISTAHAVWSGSRSGGTGNESGNCTDWTTNASTKSGMRGDTTGNAWAESNTYSCDNTGALYCFEQ